jgi:hypothetical protein
MNLSCECGMTLDRPSARHRCPECGTGICRSCSIELDAVTYCRWCATTLGRTAVGARAA